MRAKERNRGIENVCVYVFVRHVCAFERERVREREKERERR